MQAAAAGIEQHRIICLPTGTGKTFVAIMVMKHMLAEGGFACMVVNQRALVDQHAKEIEENFGPLGVKVVRLLGKTEDRKTTLSELNGVLVSTAAVFLQALDHGFRRLDADCKLIVLDECHHAKGDHPYVKILSKARERPEVRLLGLTACWLHGKFSRPEEKKRALEEPMSGGRVVSLWSSLLVVSDVRIHPDSLGCFGPQRMYKNASISEAITNVPTELMCLNRLWAGAILSRQILVAEGRGHCRLSARIHLRADLLCPIS